MGGGHSKPSASSKQLVKTPPRTSLYNKAPADEYILQWGGSQCRSKPHASLKHSLKTPLVWTRLYNKALADEHIPQLGVASGKPLACLATWGIDLLLLLSYVMLTVGGRRGAHCGGKSLKTRQKTRLYITKRPQLMNEYVSASVSCY